MIYLYDKEEIAFVRNGIVLLSEATSCNITEELNGMLECTLEHPLDERGKWKYLLEGNIIKADGQLFRIYYKVKTLSGIRVNARHIFYDLLENLLEDVTITSLTGAAALNTVLTNTQYAHPFTSISDLGGIATKQFLRKNPIEALLGSEGIIAIWGGELERDNFQIKLLQARGLDRGVLVSYGKNIQGIEETLDTSGICTRLMPVGKDALLLSAKYIDSPYIGNYPNPKIRVVEFNDCETEGSLQSAGEAYMLNNKIDIPQFNYKIDFLELSKTEEYKNYEVLEGVYLGDTVTVRHSRLTIDLKAKVIKITKNILTDRIEKVELGSFKPNIATGINAAIQVVQQEIVNVTSAYQTAIDNATKLITGSNGGNVVIRQNELGKPYEILIMDTADVMTAVNVWRWNLEGFGHSSTGINGPFDTAITQDGHIVASFLTALAISCNDIVGGTLTLGGSNNALGQISILDGNNNLVGWFKVNAATGLTDIFVNKLNATNVIETQDAREIYVNSSTGDDTSPTAGEVGTPFKSLTPAINCLQKHLIGTVNIYVTGTFTETIEIKGFSGPGELIFNLGTSTVNGTWNIRGNSVFINVTGTSSASRATLNGVVGSANEQIYIANCARVQLTWLIVNNKQYNTFCIKAHVGGHLMIKESMITNSNDTLFNLFNGQYHLYSLAGSYKNCGMRSNEGCILSTWGSIPKKYDGTATGNYVDNGGIYAWELGTVSLASGTWTTTPPPATGTNVWFSLATCSYNYQTSLWRDPATNNDLYQGDLSAFGGQGTNNLGAFWIDTANFRAGLAGKTIDGGRIYLNRLSGPGANQYVNMHLRGITNTSNSGVPVLAGADYGVVGAFFYGEMKWVTLPTQAIIDLRAGTINGLCLYDPSQALIAAGLQNANGGPKIEVTYH